MDKDSAIRCFKLHRRALEQKPMYLYKGALKALREVKNDL